MRKELAKTPPMGWNSWDCFGAGVTEKELIENADYMAKYLKKYGWEYIVCDIQWYEPKAKNNDYNNFTELDMDKYGRLIPSVNRFPSSANGKGFKPIADYCHSIGLKFGIHILRGVPRQAVHANCKIKNSKYTCRDIAHPFSVCSWNTDMYGLKNCEGAQDYYNSIVELYASWDVDFIKCDDICVTEFRKFDDPYNARHEIEMLDKAIENCGRDMVISLSPGPADIANCEHLKKHANMWRMTGDFWDDWEKLHDMFDKCKTWEEKPQSGSWPDCDMLPLGVISKNGTCGGEQGRMTKFTHDEQYTMMSLWGIFRSPLIIGGNMPENDEFTLSLLTNTDYIDMLKNSYGARQIERKETNGKGYIIWSASGKKCKYLAIFNTSEKSSKIKFDLSSILMPDVSYSLLDIWTGVTAISKNTINPIVNSHSAKLYKIAEK